MTQGLPRPPSTEHLFEEMPSGALATSVDGTILRANATFCRWLGVTPEELVGRRKLQDLFSVGARIFHQTHWLPMLQMRGSISEVKFDVRGRDGESLPMLFNAVRLKTADGECDVVSVFIAEHRHRYERELLEARRRADELVLLEQDRSVFAEQMIGIVSHDLRNPLTAVLLATRMLAQRGAGLSVERSAQLLSTIERAGERAQRLIEDLLDFTVARVGKGLAVSLRETDLHRVAERAVEETSAAYPGRTIVHAHSGGGGIVADENRLAQLLGNLIGNALTHGDADGTVSVTSSVSSGQAELTVHNTGPAIAPTVLATMFEPMVRGDMEADASRSVGLGLFIVRAIATAHGGRVAVTSSATDGTRFTTTFPRSPVAADAAPSRQ